MRFIIYGAGAIGSLFGAYLSQASYETILIGREEHVKKINESGLKVVKREGSFTTYPQAVTTPADIEYQTDDILFLTTKSQDTQEAIAELARYAPKGLPIFCFQNGVRNEEIAKQRFSNVYGGVVFFSGTYLGPGEIAHTRVDRVGLGLYSSGIDDTARIAHQALTLSGFKAFLHPSIMGVKWSKLVTNLRMAVNALTGFSGQEALANKESREFIADVLEEGIKVLLQAGIVFEDEPGQIPVTESPSRLRAMEDFTPDKSLPEEMKHRPSVWQDLSLKRGKTELDFITGEVVELGKKLGIPTPLNSLLLKLVKEMAEKRLPPGRYTIADLKRMLNS